jgi:hypothetical protein
MSDANPARSAHGTLIARQPFTTPNVFTTIGELGDIGLPGLSRKEFDVSVHNRNIDSYVRGMLRRDAMGFPIYLNRLDPTHDAIVGIYQAILDDATDGYRLTQTDGTVWIFSGGVTAIKGKAPVDGPMAGDVTIRPSGPFYLNGVRYGASS